MNGHRKHLSWVGTNLLPHEAEVRGWLSRTLRDRHRVDDVVQEAYCRVCSLDAFEQISNPRAYFFQVVRSIVVDEIRRAQVVRIESVAEVDGLGSSYEELSPERIVAGRSELQRVRAIMAHLPERCRRVVEMRKIWGLSQREIAIRLGISANVVENEASRGLRLILQLIELDSSAEPSAGSKKDERRRGLFRKR